MKKINYVEKSDLLNFVLVALENSKESVYATQTLFQELPSKKYLRILNNKINKDKIICERIIFCGMQIPKQNMNKINQVLPGKNYFLTKSFPKQRMILIDNKILFWSNDNELFPLQGVTKDKVIIKNARNYFKKCSKLL